MRYGLELKFTESAPGEAVVEGYASRFGLCDQGGDVVTPGAFRSSLSRHAARGDKVRMLWQHDPAKPIGVWDEVVEDATGLRVRGRLLPEIALAREAVALIRAGAMNGLSIGYRTVRAGKDSKGYRLLTEIDLWEVSLVTFPMLAEARLGCKASGAADDLTESLIAATEALRS